MEFCTVLDFPAISKERHIRATCFSSSLSPLALNRLHFHLWASRVGISRVVLGRRPLSAVSRQAVRQATTRNSMWVEQAPTGSSPSSISELQQKQQVSSNSIVSLFHHLQPLLSTTLRSESLANWHTSHLIYPKFCLKVLLFTSKTYKRTMASDVDRHREQILAVTILLLTLTTVLCILRIIARKLSNTKFWLDDLFIGLAQVSHVIARLE